MNDTFQKRKKMLDKMGYGHCFGCQYIQVTHVIYEESNHKHWYICDSCADFFEGIQGFRVEKL